jgi:hypothetical protein
VTPIEGDARPRASSAPPANHPTGDPAAGPKATRTYQTAGRAASRERTTPPGGRVPAATTPRPATNSARVPPIRNASPPHGGAACDTAAPNKWRATSARASPAARRTVERGPDRGHNDAPRVQTAAPGGLPGKLWRSRPQRAPGRRSRAWPTGAQRREPALEGADEARTGAVDDAWALRPLRRGPRNRHGAPGATRAAARELRVARALAALAHDAEADEAEAATADRGLPTPPETPRDVSGGLGPWKGYDLASPTCAAPHAPRAAEPERARSGSAAVLRRRGQPGRGPMDPRLPISSDQPQQLRLAATTHLGFARTERAPSPARTLRHRLAAI